MWVRSGVGSIGRRREGPEEGRSRDGIEMSIFKTIARIANHSGEK
jgi:hypothetical protein